MKKNKNLIFVLISIALGIIKALPNSDLSTLEGFAFLLAEALGVILGAFIVSALLTLIFSIFDKSILKRFIPVSFLCTMVILILITAMDLIKPLLG
jgi:hypothetical protein